MIKLLMGQIKLKLKCTSGSRSKTNFGRLLKTEAWLEGFTKVDDNNWRQLDDYFEDFCYKKEKK